VPVVAGRRVVGLLTLEHISEIIMVNAAMEHQGAGQPLTAKPDTNIYERQSV
jgi:hypothetical protein